MTAFVIVCFARWQTNWNACSHTWKAIWCCPCFLYTLHVFICYECLFRM